MNEDDLYRHLAQEAGAITWGELQRHFARGVVVVIAPGLDLIDVAARFAKDDKVSVEAWMARGQVVRANDDHAHRWTESDPPLRAVVVAPWVLVQEEWRH